jgi:Holliday junction DNA helicase RuvA
VGAEGSDISLHTHLQVREDDLSLYGFSSRQELSAFELLLSVSGVGPKVGLAILSAMDAGSLAHAVSIGDTRTLVKAPGLGPKTAQRLVLELKDKMAPLAYEYVSQNGKGTIPPIPTRTTLEQFEDDILEALVSLGYNRKDAERAARYVSENKAGEITSTAQGVKAALNVLTGNG